MSSWDPLIGSELITPVCHSQRELERCSIAAGNGRGPKFNLRKMGNVSNSSVVLRTLLTLPCSSPLNTAFFAGDVEIVRTLLRAGAELEYTNCRMWTSARYIFDPECSNRNSIELLDMSATPGLRQWDAQDRVGWTILHRAAAYGQGRDIRKMLNLQASPRIPTFQLNWLPICCAVSKGNESTFDVLASPDVMPQREIIKLRDTRGWTLLHLAAQSGSVAIITKLLKLGLHPYDTTDGCTMKVPDGLKMKELTPGDIAHWHQTLDAYEQALKNAS
jgi:ankyrin repeat protein